MGMGKEIYHTNVPLGFLFIYWNRKIALHQSCGAVISGQCIICSLHIVYLINFCLEM